MMALDGITLTETDERTAERVEQDQAARILGVSLHLLVPCGLTTDLTLSQTTKF